MQRKPSIPSDLGWEEINKARLKATRIAAMAWADAKVCRETLQTMNDLGIKPLLAAVQRMNDQIENLRKNMNLIAEATHFADRMNSSLNAIDNLINDRIKVIQEKEKQS